MPRPHLTPALSPYPGSEFKGQKTGSAPGTLISPFPCWEAIVHVPFPLWGGGDRGRGGPADRRASELGRARSFPSARPPPYQGPEGRGQWRSRVSGPGFCPLSPGLWYRSRDLIEDEHSKGFSDRFTARRTRSEPGLSCQAPEFSFQSAPIYAMISEFCPLSPGMPFLCEAEGVGPVRPPISPPYLFILCSSNCVCQYGNNKDPIFGFITVKYRGTPERGGHAGRSSNGS